MLVYVWAVLFLAVSMLAFLTIVLAEAVRWLRNPYYRATVGSRWALRHEAFRARPLPSRILLRFVSTWCIMVGILNLIAMVELFFKYGVIEGTIAVQEMYSPSAVNTYLINLAALLPALFAYHWAEKIDKVHSSGQASRRPTKPAMITSGPRT